MQMHHGSNRSELPVNKGFTIIELVFVVLILGIVSAFAMARILRGDSLDSAVVSDQLIAMARLAQQKAIGHSDVQLRVEPDGSSLVISVSDNNGLLESSSVPVAGVSLYADVNQQTACSNPPLAGLISNNNPLLINYDSLGDLESGGVGAPAEIDSGARICLSPDTNLSICISDAGFAYRGACLP